MDKTIIAYSGIISALISALIAWLIAYLKVKSEVNKIRYEMHAAYANNIIKLRLELYRELYEYIEKYTKLTQRREITLDKAKFFFEQIDEWQTKNGLILSSETNSILYSFVRKLRRITDVTEQSLQERISDNEKRTEMIRDGWAVELGLKNDLGIFGIEYFDPELKFRSYKEIDDILSKEKA